jgi:hypothetical protein
MKLTGLLKKIGKFLNPLRAAIPENSDTRGKKTRDRNPQGDLRKGTRKKDSLPEADLTTNIDRYRHPSEF